MRLATTRSRMASLRSVMASPDIYSRPEMSDYVLELAHPSGVTSDRVGPKAATLARLRRGGLPVPDGLCLTAAAYRTQLAAAGVEEAARGVATAEGLEQRRWAVQVRLAFQRSPLAPGVAAALSEVGARLIAKPPALVAVRSSRLLAATTAEALACQYGTFIGLVPTTSITPTCTGW